MSGGWRCEDCGCWVDFSVTHSCWRKVNTPATVTRELRLSYFTARRWLSMRVKHAGDRLSWWIWP